MADIQLAVSLMPEVMYLGKKDLTLTNPIAL